ncbi:DUF159 family protein [Clostridia bacterium]|nr:DUF159 family protein [Clostridia bacterium]
MCGRYFIDDGDQYFEMKSILARMKEAYGDTIEYRAARVGEIFPNDTVPVIIPAKELNLDVVPMRWGFTSPGTSRLMINARSEGIFERTRFKKSAAQCRCLVPASAFFEWNHSQPQGKRVKYRVSLRPSETDKRIPSMYFAAVYDKVIDSATGKSAARFVIITKESRGAIRTLHDRMPVPVDKSESYKWLNGNVNHAREVLFDSVVPDYFFSGLGIIS